MEEARDRVQNVADAIFDGLRQIGDVSYAVLPKDMAHALGDLVPPDRLRHAVGRTTVLAHVTGAQVGTWLASWLFDRVRPCRPSGDWRRAA